MVDLTELKKVYISYLTCWIAIYRMGIVGDFNVITITEEKSGGRPCRIEESLHFLSCLSDCNVQGGVYVASRFTWSDNRDPPNTIWRRLDRLIFNAEWFDICWGYYSHPLVWNLLRSCSSSHANQSGHIKYFKSLNIWTDYEDNLSIIQQAWSDPQAGNPFYSLGNRRLRKYAIG